MFSFSRVFHVFFFKNSILFKYIDAKFHVWTSSVNKLFPLSKDLRCAFYVFRDRIRRTSLSHWYEFLLLSIFKYCFFCRALKKSCKQVNSFFLLFLGGGHILAIADFGLEVDGFVSKRKELLAIHGVILQLLQFVQLSVLAKFYVLFYLIHSIKK